MLYIEMYNFWMVEDNILVSARARARARVGCRLVGVICLSSGAILNAAIGRFNGKGSDEQTLLRTLLDTFDAGDLVLGDAFYGTYFLLASLLDKGVDAVFEQMGARKRVTDFGTGKRLGSKDHVVEISKPKRKPDWMAQAQYDSVPERLRIRELSVDGKILITTLLSAKKHPGNSWTLGIALII